MSSASTLREELASEILPCTWAPLEQHVKRGALFLVHGPELVDVAVAVATDNKEQVALYLESGALLRPTEPQLQAWRDDDGRFRCIIVQPYVFFCEVGRDA